MPVYDIDSCTIEPSKHFRNIYMRKWGWDIFDLRDAIKMAYKVDKVGKVKYEIYTRKGEGSKKIIVIYDNEEKTMFIISGAEGK